MKSVSVLLLVAFLSGATLVQAQPSAKAGPDFWHKIGQQTLLNLESPKADIRAIALKNTIILATLHRDKVAFDPAVDRIIALCKASAAEHDLAMATLQAVGSTRALVYLAEHATEEQAHLSAEVIASVLKEHYARKSTAML